MFRFLKIILIFFLLLISKSIFADSSITVQPLDPVYQAIDILVSQKLVKDIIYGQRPFTEFEVARILKDARSNFTNLPEDKQSLFIKELLRKYCERYKNEVDGDLPKFEIDPLKSITSSFVYNTSAPGFFVNDRGIGSIDGLVTSFDANQEGRTYQYGANLYFISEHKFQVSKYFSFYARPQFVFNQSSGSAQVLNLYAKTGFMNFELEAGRDSLLLGQGEFGGMLLTSNARPLDMVKITNPHPWRPPWIFKYLGPTKLTFFVSNLGPNYSFPYAYFYGMKGTIRPAPVFEIGLSETIIMGGNGAPKVSFKDILMETFPVVKAGHNANYQDTSDHRFGILDFRLTIPPFRNSVVYWDSFFDDSPLRAWDNLDNLWNQLSFASGVYVPRVFNDGSLGLRIEYQHVSPYSYRHGTWLSGYTLDQRLLGSNLGPDGDALYSTLRWIPRMDLSAFFKFEFELHRSDSYYTTTNASGGGDKLLVLNHNPDEKHYRGILGADWQYNDRLAIGPRIGYEYVTNRNFIKGSSVNNMLAMVNFSLNFDEFSKVIH